MLEVLEERRRSLKNYFSEVFLVREGDRVVFQRGISIDGFKIPEGTEAQVVEDTLRLCHEPMTGGTGLKPAVLISIAISKERNFFVPFDALVPAIAEEKKGE
ncbi:MAG: hypothetical protein PHZ25_00405 [Candidatus Pacebacteria bacterium]|nr:hypothetical protein [Candidatus Paceibacterota bacterium]